METPDAILVRSTSLLDEELPSSLKCIARAGAGVNNIPIDRCSEKGVVVFNTPGANANAVKELVVCALLLTSRRVVDGVQWLRSQEGDGDLSLRVEKGKGAFAGPEIAGKALGVVGLGAVGVMVANAACALGMEVYGYDPYLSVDAAWGLDRSVKKCESLKAMYEIADYITLHVPLTPETAGIIGRESLSQMKNGVRILNFARGGLVDEDAMAEALSCGRAAAYATDFPPPSLLHLPGVLPMPHLGASTPESEKNCARMAADQLLDFLDHGNIKNSVNLPDVHLEREGPYRLCVLNRNVPNMIGQMTALLASEGVNIEYMINRSKKEMACTLVDTCTPLAERVLERLRAVPEILSVRVADLTK